MSDVQPDYRAARDSWFNGFAYDEKPDFWKGFNAAIDAACAPLVARIAELERERDAWEVGDAYWREQAEKAEARVKELEAEVQRVKDNWVIGKEGALARHAFGLEQQLAAYRRFVEAFKEWSDPIIIPEDIRDPKFMAMQDALREVEKVDP